MKKRNSFKLLIIVSFTFTFIFLVLKKSDAKYSNIIYGYAGMEEDTSYQKYKATLLTSFNSDAFWAPTIQKSLENAPLISGNSGYIVDITTNEVLFDNNSNDKIQIASLVKVMTALVAIEHSDLDTLIKVSEKAANIGENRMGISEGEIYTLEELLYGLVLHSGNDAAYAISEGTGYNTETFVKWMNIKAKELGMTNTYFADPSGLDDSSYSTASDLVKLTKYALNHHSFRKIVATKNLELISSTHNYLYLENQTNLVNSYPGVKGVKTGFTEKAGLCLITYAVNNEHELIGVVLGSIDRKGDMIMMLDFAFSMQGIYPVHSLL